MLQLRRRPLHVNLIVLLLTSLLLLHQESVRAASPKHGEQVDPTHSLFLPAVARGGSTLPGEYVEKKVGETGGTLRLKGFAFQVPPGMLSQEVTLSVRELPSLDEEAASSLDPARFQLLGSAYQFDAPIFTDAPMTVTLGYEAEEIPANFDTANLAVALRLESSLDRGENTDAVVSFAPIPGVVDEGEQVIRLPLYSSATVQVVAQKEPPSVRQEVLEIEPEVSGATGGRATADPFSVIVVSEASLPGTINRTQLENMVFKGIFDAYRRLALQEGFRAPAAPITVVLRPQRLIGSVDFRTPTIIYIDPTRTQSPDHVIAHEFFHVIQAWNGNPLSAMKTNAWFLEGSAEWARDAVYDATPDNYQAPTGQRFLMPLNRIPASGYPSYLYQTVVFFKWLEQARPGGLHRMLENHRSITQSIDKRNPDVRYVNNKSATYLDSLTFTQPKLSFSGFAVDALYVKDFDVDETQQGDLWHPSKLGPQHTLPADLNTSSRTTTLKAGEPGDSESNPATVTFRMKPYLSADVAIIKTPSDGTGLEGTLYLKFDAVTDFSAKAQVVNHNDKLHTDTVDLATQQEVKLRFSPGSEVYVVAAATDWKKPEPNKMLTHSMQVWVDNPCGPLPSGQLFEVTTGNELVSAVKAAPDGAIIKLAPGSYALPASAWKLHAWGPFEEGRDALASLVIDKELTLAGSGIDATIINLFGNNAEIINYSPAAKTTFRDLSLVSSSTWSPINGAGDSRLSLCNVRIDRSGARSNSSGDLLFGIEFEPTRSGILELKDTILDCARCDHSFDLWGIYVDSYDAEMEPTIDVRISDSTIAGWDYGLIFCTYDSGCGRVRLDVDCSNFSGNQVANVWSDGDSGGTEHCPSDGQ